LRFIVDECCHGLGAASLREAGHDVRYIAETDRQLSDDAVATLAIEEDRIVATADYDFGELVVRHGRRLPGVVLLASSDWLIDRQTQRLIEEVAQAGDNLRGILTIVEDERLRSRPYRPAREQQRGLLRNSPRHHLRFASQCTTLAFHKSRRLASG